MTTSNQPSAADLDHVAEETRIAAATNTPPPTPDEIDTHILFYKQAEECMKTAKATLDGYRDQLVAMVDQHGKRPDHAEQSLRLAGRRNTVTITRGTTVTINEAAVGDLERYLGDLGAQIFERLFAKQTTHKLIDGARNLLKRLDLPRRTEEKVLSLFGRCIDLKTKSPSVKIEVIQPEKPARKPRASRKQAA